MSASGRGVGGVCWSGEGCTLPVMRNLPRLRGAALRGMPDGVDEQTGIMGVPNSTRLRQRNQRHHCVLPFKLRWHITFILDIFLVAGSPRPAAVPACMGVHCETCKWLIF
jgi:hypothetical protein